MLSIFTSAKSFNNHWLGHRQLNQAGLHTQRVIWAHKCRDLRRLIRTNKSTRLQKEIKSLDANGYVSIENFLSITDHKAIVDEIKHATDRVAEFAPIQTSQTSGFGDKQFFEGGFDRYDGSTLNRFIDIHSQQMPQLAHFARNPDLSALSRQITGRSHQKRKTNIYLMIHGAEEQSHDLQKDFHRDTFFSAMKFWYFPQEVTLADGPFIYVPGSHRLTPLRLQWEHDTAMAAIETQTQPNVGGSFRIAESQLPQLDLPDPVAVTCPANTLVIANVFGFHRRGDAEGGRPRLSVYGWQRPSPFVPI
ncbi:phytanoyl-CoA dioxygenase family protein [Gynuella sp.]|uniref:phytanoyl-CoA dioxygenase family protein n=1 Tax=Gynuella sp. TaxID=2969146 RepID=UPI003D151A43